VPSASELLSVVENAINSLLSNRPIQSYSIGDRNIRYLSLKELYELRRQLQAEVAAENGQLITYPDFRPDG